MNRNPIPSNNRDNNNNNHRILTADDLIKDCRNCMYYKPNPNGKLSDAFCTFFKTAIEVDGEEWEMYDYAVHCRKNEYLCGLFAYMYEER